MGRSGSSFRIPSAAFRNSPVWLGRPTRRACEPCFVQPFDPRLLRDPDHRPLGHPRLPGHLPVREPRIQQHLHLMPLDHRNHLVRSPVRGSITEQTSRLFLRSTSVIPGARFSGRGGCRFFGTHTPGCDAARFSTLGPHWRSYVHPYADRVISVREAARLQSFPDRFRFYGLKSEMMEQVGNAVPPLLAAAVGRSVLNHINRRSCRKEIARLVA